MSNVLVEKNKLDILANAISNKSGEPLKLTLDEMVEAVDGIENNPAPTLQAKAYTVDSAGTETVTADSGYDGLSEVEVSVPSAIVVAEVADHFFTQNNVRKWEVYANAANFNEGYLYYGQVAQDSKIYNAIPTGTTVTPTESAQTIGGADTMMEGAVTVSAIPSNYVGSGITQRSSSDLTANGATVTVPSGYYSASASKSVASGTAGTPTATKGTVSNHSVSVTPSVTNTTGYITGGTKSGTAVSVSASELVSGSETKTQNGTYDVTNLAELVVNVQGGGGTVNIGTKTVTNSDDQANHIEFTDMEGRPKAFFLRCTSQLTRSSSYSYYYITTIRYNGTNTYGNYYRKSNGSYYNDTTHYYYGYTGTTFTLYTNSTRGSAGGSFYNGTYELVYIY